jgi:hypothetical protein
MQTLPPSLPVPVELTPMHMLQMAVQQGADLDKLEKLMGLQERWEATQARKAYVIAMGEFKAHPPVLYKNKAVSYGQTSYNHATHDEVTGKVAAGLAAHGLSHRWNVEQDPARISVTCTITHVGGHSESVTLSAAADQSGGKNAIQAIGSAVSYLERYTLLAATGLSTSEGSDDDRIGTKPAKPPAKKPPLFDKWWANTKAAASDSSKKLAECWQAAPVGCRGYVSDTMPGDWTALKAQAVKADLAVATGAITP